MIKASLEPFIPQIQYRELERCGHYPWLERGAANQFFDVVRTWLAHQLNAREA